METFNTTHDNSSGKGIPAPAPSSADSSRVLPAEVNVPTNTRPSLVFPESGYVGVSATIADEYSQRYESPKEFVYLDLLTGIGLVISGRLRADFGEMKVQPRLYTLKVAKSGWMRKSSSTSFARKVIDRAVKLAEKKARAAALAAEQASDPLATAQATTRSLMRVVAGVGSAEGLANAFQASPRILLTFDEFRRLEKKANAKDSVLTYMLNELYEGNEYDNHTKTSALEVKNGHLAILSNTTENVYLSLQNGAEMADVGFLNRFFLVYSEKLVRKPRPKAIPADVLDPLIEELAEKLAALPPLDEHGNATGEIALPLTPEADKLWAEFYVELEQSPLTTRLDSMGPRLMSLLAFLADKQEIDAEIVQATLDILEYQRRVREVLQPDDGVTPDAKVENAMLRQLKNRGELSERELKQFSNCGRQGRQACKRALDSLKDAKEIAARLETGGKKPVRMWRTVE
jgi:hypothetical protein